MIYIETKLLDATADIASIREYFVSQGADLNSLLGAAQAHFVSSEIHRRTGPLTTAEMEGIIEDDDNNLKEFVR